MHTLSLAKTPGSQNLQRTTNQATAQPVPKQSGVTADLLSLQHAAGNYAVNRLLQQARGTLQAKLKVNQPGDVYEQEADRISEQVMRMPEPQLQRACACGGACAKCQTKEPEREDEILQTKRGQTSDTGQMVAPPVVHKVLRSPGQPLDPATCAFMEPRFGYDFSRVRVHTGTDAEQSAEDVNATAYTVGHHIVFGTGQYTPSTRKGQWLLAHELAHVVQGSPGILHRNPDRNPGPTYLPTLPVQPSAKVSPREAVDSLKEKLLGIYGLFYDLAKIVHQFSDNMQSSKEEEGTSDYEVSGFNQVAKMVVKEGLKMVGEKMKELVINAAKEVSPPAATVAQIILPILIEAVHDDYKPVITAKATKKPYQCYVESVEKTLEQAHKDMLDPFIANEEELEAKGVSHVRALTASVDESIAKANKRFYFELVRSYIGDNPGLVSIPTPHAEFSAQPTGWGGHHWETEVGFYVEFEAKGLYSPDPKDISVVRTIVPRLPRDVMAELSGADESITIGDWIGPAGLDMYMEGMWEGRPVKLTWKRQNLQLPTNSPYTDLYLIAVAEAVGAENPQSYPDPRSPSFSIPGSVWNGAIRVYTQILNTPLKKASLSYIKE